MPALPVAGVVLVTAAVEGRRFMPFVKATNGPEAGRRYDLNGPESVLGRHPDCQIVVDVGAVSRQHAKILTVGGDFFLEDLNSRNGTLLNGKLINERQKLRDGDLLQICDVAFSFHDERKPPPSILAPSGAAEGTGTSTVLIDDMADESGSTIMSKVDVSSDSTGRLQMVASPEVKLNAILEISRNLGKALALDEVLPQLLNGLFKIFVQADRGFIVMRTEEGRLAPLWTKVRRKDSDDTIRISRTIVERVMETKEAILSADAAADSRFEMSQSIADFRIRSMMCAPLLDSERKSIGVLQIDTLDQRKRFQPEDLEVLASVAVQAGTAIDNARLHDASLRQQAVERDLEVAREVQRGFLPKNPAEVTGYSFFNYYEPANHVGGDYFDYIFLPDGRIAVLVADVVGHGIAAALLMAKLSAEARFSLAVEPDPARAVTRLNAAMSQLQVDRFVTMIMGVLNPNSNEVTIVNAGHMAPMLRHADGTVDEPGEELAGLPLGITDDFEYEQHQITLQPGELLTMYTDGINECSNNQGEMYGIESIRQKVQEATTGVTPQKMGETIVADVRRFMGATQQDDDMCLVCFGRVE
jgi:serine phosphatase RsbU (regulator of sigma subunit)